MSTPLELNSYDGLLNGAGRQAQDAATGSSRLAFARPRGRSGQAQVRVRARKRARSSCLGPRRGGARRAQFAERKTDERCTPPRVREESGLESRPPLLTSTNGPYGAWIKPSVESIRQSRVKMPL